MAGFCSDEEISRIYRQFEECGSIREIDRQLAEGLVTKVEHARYTLQVWEEHKRLPQNHTITSAFPLMF